MPMGLGGFAPQPASPSDNRQAAKPLDKWSTCKWTVYRGVAYDISSFIDRHPGGSWLVRMAVGRDCTGMVESNHLRQEVVLAAFQKLPVLKDFPVHAVDRSPYPSNSKLYNTIRARVRAEVFKGEESKGTQRAGTASAALLTFTAWALTYAMFLWSPTILTGSFYGAASAWVAMVLQHSGNHGSLLRWPWLNALLYAVGDMTTGTSSLLWRHHHQVSHHVHTNDEELDQDVFSAYPLVRFDARLPRRWWHRYQHIYVWALFPFLWLGFLGEDIEGLVTNHCHGGTVTMHGATAGDRLGALLGKILWLVLLVWIPCHLHGAYALVGAFAWGSVASTILSVLFAVNHSMPTARPLGQGLLSDKLSAQEREDRDWCTQQVVASVNWGSPTMALFNSGLSLQIEHHLFPAVSFAHYPAIAPIVAEECLKHGVPYVHYKTLAGALQAFVRFMRETGVAPDLKPAPKKNC